MMSYVFVNIPDIPTWGAIAFLDLAWREARSQDMASDLGCLNLITAEGIREDWAILHGMVGHQQIQLSILTAAGSVKETKNPTLPETTKIFSKKYVNQHFNDWKKSKLSKHHMTVEEK